MAVNRCLTALPVGPWDLEGVALALSVATPLETLLLFYRLMIRAGPYRQRIENHIRAGNTTLPSLGAWPTANQHDQ
jgi:hypothetical protein